MSELKQITCKNKGCKNRFTQFNSIVVWCSPKCGQEIAEARQRAKYKEETLAMKRKFNENDRRHQLKLAQQEFNKFIRLRDIDEPCISCGTTDQNLRYDAGHYLTAGAYPELRFNEDNCHKQCHYNCNINRSGNVAAYRINLQKKIGVGRLAILEGPHDRAKLSLDQIKAIKFKYREKRKLLESQLKEAS